MLMTDSIYNSAVIVVILLSTQRTSASVSGDFTSGHCSINSLCECRSTEFNCFSVPLHKLPEWPHLSLQSMDVTGAVLRELEEGALDGLRLNSLALAGNKLSEIASNSLKSMSISLLTLDLGYNELTHVPFGAFHNLHVLFWINLQNNQIASMCGDWSHLKDSLTSISLSNNELTLIESDSLNKLKYLARLDIDGNRFHSIHANRLPQSLMEIKASGNLIDSLHCSDINYLPRIKVLILRDNHISNIPLCTFKHTKKIDKLDLSDNLIYDLYNPLFNLSIQVRNLNLELNFMTEIRAQTFRHMKISKLVLSHNRLEIIEEQAFDSLEQTLEQLELDNNRLQSLPENFTSLINLKYLSLASNYLNQLNSIPVNLETIILSRNSFLEIPSTAFREMNRNLQNLDFSYNVMTRLQKEDFTGWGETITTLILKGNKITRLEDGLFTDLFMLRKLNLNFNELHYLHINIFTNLSSNLKSLEMSQSMYCEDFPVDVFSPLENLVWLSLDNNNYRSIQEYALSYFHQLQYINLESNQLTILPVNLFNSKVLNKLRDIRLSYNLIDILDIDTFSSLVELKTVDVSVNKIQNISSSSFKALPKLVFISLASNLVRNIGVGAFSDLPNLLVLELQNNELSEFSLNSLFNVSSHETPLNLNLSHNQIILLNGDEHNFIEILDLSHNSLVEPAANFFVFISKRLKKLILSYNRIENVDSNIFSSLINLQILKLDHNFLKFLHRRAFTDLYYIQILDLSYNEIEQLHSEQFANLRNLRYLILNHNRIRSCPREVFKNTVLEHLDLSSNQFKVYPNVALSHVGFTLRYLDIRHNFIEYLDSTIFQDTPFLLELYLGNNRITTLSDNTFNSVLKLRVLDLSSNNLRANFKELLHFLPNLRHLSLANCGLKLSPHLPLRNVTNLNLSSNYLDDIQEETIKDLLNLRKLYIANNRFKLVPSHLWHYLKYLNILDLSWNPIHEITNDSFRELSSLRELNICHLQNLNRFTIDALKPLVSLSSIVLQTWSHANRYHFNVGKILSFVPSLSKLSIYITDETLSKQLVGVFKPKLKFIEIWGENLQSINAFAFYGSENNKELALKITNTNISELPLGFFDHLGSISQLSIDLSNNKLSTLRPAVLYPNTTKWDRMGTRLISGGLLLNNNPLQCQCELTWIGGWLRRWLRESLEVGNAPSNVARALHDAVRVATCSEPGTGKLIPLLQLRSEDTDCFASALASGKDKLSTSPFFVFVHILTLVYYFSRYIKLSLKSSIFKER